MGVPLDSLFQPAEALAERALPVPVLHEMEKQALTKRPDLKRIQSQEAAQQQSVAMAKSSFGPRVNAFAGWEMDNPTFVAGGGGNNWLGGVEVQFDIFQGGAKRAELSRQRALADRVGAMKQAATDAVRLEVRRAYYDVDASRQQVEVARAAIAQAQESLRINQDRYDSGLDHHHRSAGRGRSGAPQPDRLLGSGLPVPYQLREPGVGQRNAESSISGGDAMNRHQFNSFTSRSLWLWFSPAGSAVAPANAQPVAAAPETVHNVSVLPVQRADVPDLLEAVGTVRAAQTSQLASQMTGNIVEIRVHEGDRVRRGQVLAVIDDAQPRAALDQATAAENAAEQELAASDSDLALAQSTLKRYQNLYDKKSVSPQEFDEVKARYQAAVARRDMTRAGQAQAKAALAQARTSFSYTRIRRAF